MPVNGAAILCCWLAADAHRDEPRIRRGWRWMSAAALSYLLGDLAQTWIEVVRHQHLPVFGWSDVVYLGFYPLALAGLLSFPTTRRSRQERFTLALDIAVVTVGAASIIWTSYLEPTLPAGRAVPSADLALLVYPVGDLVLLFGVVSVLLRGCAPGTSGPLRTLVAGLGLYLVADLIYGQMRLHGSYIGGDAVDTGWIAALILFSLGAVAHVRRARLASDPVDPITESSTPNVAGPPYVAVLVGFGLLLFICRHLPFFPVGGIVLAAGLQTALVMVRQVIARRENAQLLGRFHTLARTDDLTGLYNRRHFLELAESVFAAWRRVDRPLTMLMIDIDGFKKINDRFGHETGDQVLRAVADVCRTQLRPDDLVGRYGGDELVALLPDTPAPEAASIAGQLQERLRDLLVQTGVGAQPSTLSIGVAELGDARSLDVLLARAELALYDAKRAGSNCVRSNGRG